MTVRGQSVSPSHLDIDHIVEQVELRLTELLPLGLGPLAGQDDSLRSHDPQQGEIRHHDPGAGQMIVRTLNPLKLDLSCPLL